MSIGFCGLCRKEAEDEKMVLYTYAGENWNDHGKSKSGDSLLYDGYFIIYKDCLEEPEIHTRMKRMPSGRKRTVVKRIPHFPAIFEHVRNGRIVVEKECKNAFRYPETLPIDYIAYHLLLHIFTQYQLDGALPEKEAFII